MGRWRSEGHRKKVMREMRLAGYDLPEGTYIRKKNRSYLKSKRSSKLIHTADIKTSRIKYLTQEQLAPTMDNYKKSGTYDPRKDPGSQLNRTGNSTKEENRWVNWIDGGKKGPSPWELKHPPDPYANLPKPEAKPVEIPKITEKAPEEARKESIDKILTKEHSDFLDSPIKEIDKSIGYLDESGKKISLEEFKKQARSQFGNKDVGETDKPFEKFAELKWINLGKNLDPKSDTAIQFKKVLSDDEHKLFLKDPDLFIKTHVDMQGPWLEAKRQRNEDAIKKIRRHNAENKYPDYVPWWIAIGYDNNGDGFYAERPKTVNGKLKYYKWNNEVGAFHSTKKRIIDEKITKPASAGQRFTETEVKHIMKSKIYGIAKIRSGPYFDDVIKKVPNGKYNELKTKYIRRIIASEMTQPFKKGDIEHQINYMRKQGWIKEE